MSTRATVYIHGSKYDSDLMDIKLYHHRDGYIEYLGVKLEEALEKRRKNLNRAMKNGSYGDKKTLIQCIAEIGGFELAYPIHGDAEYVYHVYFDIENGKAKYELYCQNGYDEEMILKSRKALLSRKGYGNMDRKIDTNERYF